MYAKKLKYGEITLDQIDQMVANLKQQIRDLKDDRYETSTFTSSTTSDASEEEESSDQGSVKQATQPSPETNDNVIVFEEEQFQHVRNQNRRKSWNR